MKLTVILSTLPLALSCITLPRSSSSGPPITFGPDTPADPSTTGYSLNHLSLNVRNLTASIAFYTTTLGLRHVFTVAASQHLSIAYLGHAHGGHNGTGYQTTAEIAREKNNAQGLLELIHIDVAERGIVSPGEHTNGVGHIGVVVPDVEAAQKRLEGLGAKILKGVGEDTPRDGHVAVAQGFSEGVLAQIEEGERKVIEKTLDEINRRFIYVEDPDGNILEIQPQD